MLVIVYIVPFAKSCFKNFLLDWKHTGIDSKPY